MRKILKIINCYKEKNPSINRVSKKVSIEEGQEIATKLFNILNSRKDGIGLAAPQCNIDARVAVVNVREPIILINPEIVKQWDEIDYYEGCLSFPKKPVHTKRYKYVIVKCDNYEEQLYLGPLELGNDSVGTWENGKSQDDLRLLESVCVQHEVDHCFGQVIFDRESKVNPIRVKKKWRRNELVSITDGKEIKEIKYKKAKSLIDSGDWEIYTGSPIT